MTIEYHTGKTDIILVKMPEGLDRVSISHNAMWENLSYRLPGAKAMPFGWTHVKLPTGRWKIAGNPFDLSRIQCSELVKYQGLPWNAYKDYTNDKNWFNSPIDSFKSMLNHLKVYQVNPYGMGNPIMVIGHKGSEKICETILNRYQEEYQEAEERTGNWLLLIKQSSVIVNKG